MSDKSEKLNEKLKIHGEAIQKSMSGVSETARQAIADINAGFDEAQRRVDEMQRLADFAKGKPPKGMAYEHLGIVHGSEFVISPDDYKAKRNVLDKHFGSENVNRSIDNDSDLVVTINVPN